MRGKILRWLMLIITLMISSTIVGIASSTPVLFVDPPSVVDDTLQPPASSFTVDIDVSDVVDLYAWQVNMTWDTSILDLYDIYYADLIGVADPWYSKPHSYVRLPYTEQEVSPTSTSGSWSVGFRAFFSDDVYTTADTADVEQIYGDYGFNTGVMTAVTELRVGAEAKVIPERDRVTLQLYNGAAWGPVHTFYPRDLADDSTFWLNVTDDFAWTPSMLSNANFEVSMTYVQIGKTTSTVYADTLVVEERYWGQSRTPTTSATSIAGWADPLNVTTSDDWYATCATANAEETYGDFGFNTGAMADVRDLWAGLELNLETMGPTELEVQVSNNGGAAWGPNHTVVPFESELLTWVDVTSDFAWTPSMLSNANFKVRIRYKQLGTTLDTIYVDHLPVMAIDALQVTDPDYAYDTILGSYASFDYSERDTGYFRVYDFGHEFPSGVANGIDEEAIITQVDLHIRYSTGASAAGDQYRITYNTDYFSAQTLVAWSSSATPLNTYTFTDIQDYDPFFPDWTWVDLEKLRVTVDVDRVGGDPSAFFNLHEVWLSVSYTKPVGTGEYVEEASGWALFSQNVVGAYYGISGSGTLATVEFNVTAYGYTDLDFNLTATLLLNHLMGEMTFTPEIGYFRNLYPGDVDGDKYVGSADAGILNGAYGTWRGDPLYVRESDFDDDTYIGSADAGVLNGVYGTTYP